MVVSMTHPSHHERVVRVFHDWGAEWPLWESGDKYAMEPSDYNLSDPLTELLQECGQMFYAYNMPFDGWSSRRQEEIYLEKMRLAVEQLRKELAGVAAVDDSLLRS